MWQILLGLFVATEKLQHWDFNPSTSDMGIPISTVADEDLQWWMSGYNVLMGARVIPKDPDAYFFMDALNIGWVCIGTP